VINAMHLEAATNFPLLNVFWTMLFFFAWMVWAFLFIYIAFDIFSSQDLNGLAKVLWLLLLLIPFIGAAIYLIVRGKGMGGSHSVVGSGGRRHWW
jgi:Phospholipase_D-nuclease N-terminal